MDRFTTRQAAVYLGLSVSTVRYHVYVRRNLRPGKFGPLLIFSRDELDAFTRERRRPGRPRKENHNGKAENNTGRA
jgi:hypothetical protein